MRMNAQKIRLTCSSFREILALLYRQGADKKVIHMRLTLIHSPACSALIYRWFLRRFFPYRHRREGTLTIDHPMNGFILM